MRGRIQSLTSKGLLHSYAWAFPKILGCLLWCQCSSCTAKKPLAGEKQEERKEHGAKLPRAFTEEGVCNRNFPWLGLRPVSVHAGVTGSDFTSFDTYHKHSGFVIHKSYQTLLILGRISSGVITVHNYLCREKHLTIRKFLRQAEHGKVTDEVRCKKISLYPWINTKTRNWQKYKPVGLCIICCLPR